MRDVLPAILAAFLLAVPRPKRPRPFGPAVRARKQHVGRNERCPCGSGKKFKRCCYR